MIRKVNIMPMAGDGQRFKDSNYSKIKPLIKIKNIEIFLHAARSMPKADLWIFIIRDEHDDNKEFTNIIRDNFVNFEIISTNKKTEGQASSCLLSLKFLKDSDIITVCSCDLAFKIKSLNYFNLFKKYQGVIFTSKKNHHALKNPNQFGWVNNISNTINNISCKEIASSNPINDDIIIGAFGFCNKVFFKKSIDYIINKNIRIKNEFYLDVAMQQMFFLNYKIANLKVNNYISYGSPKELIF
jgi:dTDP-glucose pyrophosphorylase